MVGIAGFLDRDGGGKPAHAVVLMATLEGGSAWALELSRRGHAVTLCASPDASVEASRFMGHCPVLVGDGFTDTSPVAAAHMLRQLDPSVPVLALVCGPGDRVTQQLLDRGAHDVLDFDSEPARVSGRIRTMTRLRRFEPEAQRYGKLDLDARSRTVRAGSSAIELRPREFGVLLHLVNAAGRVVPFQELQDVQWADQADGDAAMRSCVYRLRKALQDGGGFDVEIETVRNRGYRLQGLQPTEGG